MFKTCLLSEGFDFDKIALCVKYGEYPVYYSLTMRGMAIEIHVSAKGRAGKLKVREASKAVIDWIPKAFPWCKMLIATVSSNSVYNLCKKTGFLDMGMAEKEGKFARLMVINYG